MFICGEQALSKTREQVEYFDEKLTSVQSALSDLKEISSSFERCV